MSTRIGLTITEEMDEIIEQIAADQNRRKADIVRFALEEYIFRERGVELTESLEYGGRRERKSEGED